MGPNTTAAPARPGRRGGAARLGALALHGLDLAIALGRKVGGFCALLTLGWTYLRLLVLGQDVAQLYPGAPDPDLRQTLWVALLLVMAQGWDVSTDQIAAHWRAVRAALPPARTVAPRRRAPPSLGFAGPMVVHLGRFMDLCVAIANKVGAFAVLVTLGVLAAQFALGASVRAMYPAAADPTASFLADLAVYLVVLGWWATPFEQIATFWRRLRGRPPG